MKGHVPSTSTSKGNFPRPEPTALSQKLLIPNHYSSSRAHQLTVGSSELLLLLYLSLLSNFPPLSSLSATHCQSATLYAGPFTFHCGTCQALFTLTHRVCVICPPSPSHHRCLVLITYSRL